MQGGCACGVSQGRGERGESPGSFSIEEAQNSVGFWGRLLVYFQLFIWFISSSSSVRTPKCFSTGLPSMNSFPVCPLSGIALTQVQPLALGLVEPLEVLATLYCGSLSCLHRERKLFLVGYNC